MGKLTDQQKIDITKEYQLGNTFRGLGRKYEVGHTAIKRILMVRKIQLRPFKFYRKYNVNENFFEKIDTPTKAQILGFLCADGSVQPTGAIRVVQTISDKNYLEEINKIIESNRPLTFIDYSKKRNGLGHPKSYKSEDQYSLDINSLKMYNDLNKLGCTPAKSCTLQFPTEVPKELIKFFILGYFEGDGGISIKDNKTRIDSQFMICGTESICKNIKLICEESIKTHLTLTNRCRNNNNHYSISCGGNYVVEKILDWLYKNAPFVMQRKYEKYLLIKKYCKLREIYGTKIKPHFIIPN